MSICNTSTTYGSVAKFLHWLIAVLVIGMLAFGFFMGDIPKDYKGTVYNLHKLTGITVLFLMVLRALWALMNPKPRVAGASMLEKLGERIVHFGLYIFVIAMPLAGWIGSSAANKAPHLGDWVLRLPIEESKTIPETAFNLHEQIAWIIIGLLCIHIAAALYHHYIRKDNILRRMWF